MPMQVFSVKRLGLPAAEPCVMLGALLLLPNEVTHEIAQKLRGSPVTAFGGVGELRLQRLIDPESKGCFAHGQPPHVVIE